MTATRPSKLEIAGNAIVLIGEGPTALLTPNPLNYQEWFPTHNKIVL
jgi:hypothetical protein